MLKDSGTCPCSTYYLTLTNPPFLIVGEGKYPVVLKGQRGCMEHIATRPRHCHTVATEPCFGSWVVSALLSWHQRCVMGRDKGRRNYRGLRGKGREEWIPAAPARLKGLSLQLIYLYPLFPPCTYANYITGMGPRRPRGLRRGKGKYFSLSLPGLLIAHPTVAHSTCLHPTM